jgi:hypothetical protein
VTNDISPAIERVQKWKTVRLLSKWKIPAFIDCHGGAPLFWDDISKLLADHARMKSEAAYERDKSPRIAALEAALSRAVDAYGKPGGPWNVPSEPGSWIDQARQALRLGR